MSDAAIFATVFVSIFVLRIAAATLVFYWILPQGDRCPNCNAVTIRLQATGLSRCMPWFRSSWCIACGWRGLLRHGPVSTSPSTSESTLTRHR
jgi:hypothetical protein